MPYRNLTVISLALALAACGSRGTSVSGESPRSADEITVTVKNENFYDATVYACRSTRQQRLGVVSSNNTRTFTFRWVTGPLRMLVDFTGAGSHISDMITVEPGDNVDFVITSQMHRGPRLNRCF